MMSLFARLDIAATAAAGAACGALVLFLATAALLVQGAPADYPVGPNLEALRAFAPGYSVTWPGSLVGAAFGAVYGAIFGLVLAAFWNFAHLIVIGVIVLQGDWYESE